MSLIFFVPSVKEDLPSQCLLHNKPKHDCCNCVWWILRKDEKRTGNWDVFKKKKDEYIKRSSANGYGYLLARDGQITVGLAQFGPKRMFPYLEDLKKGSTDSDNWIVVCLQANDDDETIKTKLLKEIVERARASNIRVPKVIASVLKNSGVKSVHSAGSAEAYLSVGFEKTLDIDENYVLVEYDLQSLARDHSLTEQS